MFLKKTFRKFFIKDGSHDLYWFLFGLVFLFTFTLIRTPRWIFCLGLGVLTSAIFRYITTDSMYYDDFKNLDNRKDRLNYISSKNIFTILFLAAFILVLYFIINIGIKIGLVGANYLEFKMVFTIIIYILATENIILIFNHKLVVGYKSGYKRNYSEDLGVGITNLKFMIPSLFVNISLLVLIFVYKMNLNIVAGIFYLFVSTVVFSVNKRLNFH